MKNGSTMRLSYVSGNRSFMDSAGKGSTRRSMRKSCLGELRAPGCQRGTAEPDLPARIPGVVEMVKHQRHDRSVDGLVGEPIQRVAKIVDPKVRDAADLLPGTVYQCCAAIEANDISPALH